MRDARGLWWQEKVPLVALRCLLSVKIAATCLRKDITILTYISVSNGEYVSLLWRTMYALV